VKTLLDTGPLVALLNRDDHHHAWALDTFDTLSLPLWTCAPVLTEAAYLTGRAADIMEMVADGHLRLGLDMEAQADAIQSLLTRYGKRMDLADACLVRMSELNKRSQLLTLDRRDFSYYRRNGREVIPLIAP